MTCRGFSPPDLECDDSLEQSPEAALDPLDLSNPSPNKVTATKFSGSQRSIKCILSEWDDWRDQETWSIYCRGSNGFTAYHLSSEGITFISLILLYFYAPACTEKLIFVEFHSMWMILKRLHQSIYVLY